MEEISTQDAFKPFDIAKEVIDLILTRIDKKGEGARDQAMAVLNIAMAMKANFPLRFNQLRGHTDNPITLCSWEPDKTKIPPTSIDGQTGRRFFMENGVKFFVD